MTIYVLECKPYDPSTGTQKFVTFAAGVQDDASLAQSQPYPLRLRNTFTFEQGVYQQNVPGDTALSIGTISLNNIDGKLDYLLNYSWGGCEVILKSGPDSGGYAGLTTFFTGAAQDISSDQKNIGIVLRDSAWKMVDALQKNRYLGSGGAEGFKDLATLPKPLCFGLNKNGSPVLVDQILLTYQVHDGPIVALTAVYDDAVLLTPTTDYATYALLAAATIAPGTYATCTAQGFFRLGAPPAGVITFDAQGQFYSSVNLAATLQQILLAKTVLTASDLDAASFTQLAADSPYRCSGIYYPQPDIAINEFVQNMVGMVDAFWYITSVGKLKVRKFKFNFPVATFDAEKLVGIQRLINTKPVYKATVAYDRNLTIASADQFSIPSNSLVGYIADEKVNIASPYTGSGQFEVFIGGTQVNSLKVVDFQKVTTASWLTLNADGTFTWTDPGTDASVTLRASMNEFKIDRTFTIKRVTGVTYSVAVTEPRVLQLKTDGTPVNTGQTLTFTLTTNQGGTDAWSAVDNLNNAVALTGAGSSRSLAITALSQSPLVTDVTVMVTNGTYVEVITVPISRGTNSPASGIAQNTIDIAAATAALNIINSDNWLSRNEKPQVINLYNSAYTEYNMLVNASTTINGAYGIDYTASQRTAATTAMTNLQNYLNGLSPSWTNLLADTPVVGATLTTNFSNVFTANQNLKSANDAVARTRADLAQTDATNSLAKIAVINSDGYLSAGEKPDIIRQYNDITTEYPNLISQATSFGVSSSAYTTAYNALVTYITGLSPAYNSTTTDTVVVPATFNQKFSDYYAARQNLLNSFDTNSKSRADAAQADATSSLAKIAIINSDGYLSASEKPDIIRQWNDIAAEYPNLITQASNFGVSSTTYASAYTALGNYLSSLSPAWNSTTTDTVIVPATFNQKFSDYYSARQSLLNNIDTIASQLANWPSIFGTGKPESWSTSGGNQVYNGDGELGTTTGWILSGASAGASIGVTTSTGVTRGKYALTFNKLAIGDFGSISARAFPVTPGQVLVFRYSFTGSASTGSGFYARFFYSATAPSSGYVDSLSSPSWYDFESNAPIFTTPTYREFKFTVPAGVYWIMPTFYSYINGPTTLVVDQVEVVPTISWAAGLIGPGKPADNATADIKLTSITGTNALVSGNQVTNNLGGDSWNTGSWSPARIAPVYIAADIDEGANHTIILGLDDDTTSWNYTDQKIYFYYVYSTGAWQLCYNGGTIIASGTQPGIKGKMILAYDGVNVIIAWGSNYFVYAPPAGFTTTTSLYPKVWPYSNGMTVTGIQTGNWADVTALQQVIITSTTTKSIAADYTGVIASGVLPTTVASPKVVRGGQDITQADTVQYAISATSGGCVGNVTVDTTNGSGTKGVQTIGTGFNATGSYQLQVTVSGVLQATISVTVTKKLAEAPTGGGGGGGGSSTSGSISIGGYAASGGTFAQIGSTISNLTLASGKTATCSGGDDYVCQGSGLIANVTIEVKWQYSPAGANSWTDVGTSQVGVTASYNQKTGDDSPGSVSLSRTVAPSAASYDFRLMARVSSGSSGAVGQFQGTGTFTVNIA